jgi:hypothetical protein
MLILRLTSWLRRGYILVRPRMYSLLTKRIEIPGVRKLYSKMPWLAEVYSTLIHPAKWAAFIRRPWPLSRAFGVSVVVGVIVPPIISSFIYHCLPLRNWGLPWRFSPSVFVAALAILLGLLYWQVDRAQFRPGRGAFWVTSAAGLIWTVGIIGSVWCYDHHVCMGGHMQHPPYPAWHYGLDVAWSLCLVGAAVWTRLFRASSCLTFAMLSSFVLSYRFLFGSFGAPYAWPL